MAKLHTYSIDITIVNQSDTTNLCYNNTCVVKYLAYKYIQFNLHLFIMYNVEI